jgi:hypothetical protein
VNSKKVYRLYRDKLSVRRRQKTGRPVGERQTLRASCWYNDTWRMDFVFVVLAERFRIKCLTMGGDFTRESVDIPLDPDVSGVYVVRLLDKPPVFGAILAPYAPTTGPSSPAARSSPGRSSNGGIDSNVSWSGYCESI